MGGGLKSIIAYLDGDIHSQRLLHLTERDPKIFKVVRLHEAIALLQTCVNLITLLKHGGKASLNFFQLVDDDLRFSTNTFDGMILVQKSGSAPVFQHFAQRESPLCHGLQTMLQTHIFKTFDILRSLLAAFSVNDFFVGTAAR